MKISREEFYKRGIAELEKQVAELLKANKALVKKNTELSEQVMKLTNKIAKLSKNSSNSSKAPSSAPLGISAILPKRRRKKRGAKKGHQAHLRELLPQEKVTQRIERQAVLWRKSSFGTQSERGARYVERILTACATCRLQERSIIEYLRDACRCHLNGISAPSLIKLQQLTKTA